MHPVLKFLFFFNVLLALPLHSEEVDLKAGKQKLADIHATLSLKYGNLNQEYPEQLMAALFIPPDATVLELGGNIGRNSCTIASLLDDSSRLVVFESDPAIAKQLEENRALNHLNFYIEAAAISKVPLFQKHWLTTPDNSSGKSVAIMSVDDVKEKYRMPFDTLVADCEGALYYILRDDPSLLQDIQLIVVENDYLQLEHYEFVKELFLDLGFERIYSAPLTIDSSFPCKGNFFEVWRRLKINAESDTCF